MNILKEYLIKLVNLLVWNFLPKSSLLQIYVSFVRPHLDDSGFIYDEAFIGSFQNKLESIHYNATLPITRAIRGTSRENIFELGSESLQDRRWYRKFCVFYKILINMSPKYLSDKIQSTTRRYFKKCKQILYEHLLPVYNNWMG